MFHGIVHRSYTPSLAPDGRPFPVSLTISRGPVHFPPTANTTDAVSMTTGACSTVGSGQEQRGHGFPHNVLFVHVSLSALDVWSDIYM